MTTKINARDVAQYILNESGPVPTMKLQKLVYYCQAWSLVWDDIHLFDDKIEAWANGPVVPELFYEHQGQFLVQEISQADPDKLNQTQKETVDAVLQFYGDKPSHWLSDLTHMEEPWQKAREGLPAGERGDREITHRAMCDYYSSL